MAVKKKILIVNDLLQGGGVEKLMYDLVWNWHDRYDITVMTYQFCPGADELLPENVHYLSASLEKEYRRNLPEKAVNKFRKKWKEHSYQQEIVKAGFDIAIAIKDGWIMKKVADMDIPVKFAWIHTDYNNYYYSYDLFGGPDNERECMKCFRKVVCVSEDIAKGIRDVIGDPGNLIVRYNPIDIQQILEKGAEPVVDVDTAKVPGVPRFVTVGRLNHQKGYDLLLEACHMLELDGLKFQVWVIGGEESWSDEHNRLYRAQKRMGVTSVQFLGGRRNPYKYMKQGDWFLSSSIFEGYSLVSQEAAVLGVPLILTGCSGVRELVGDSEYGVVMGISVWDIYQGMKRVIEQPELCDHYREKIIERRETIQFEERIAAIEELFE